MMEIALSRRAVLQSGAALAAPVALAGLLPAAAPARVAAPLQPLSGSLVGWVAMDPNSEATAKLFQLDTDSRPGRQIGAARLAFDPSATSMSGICRRAQEMAVQAVARSWSVPAAECVVSHGRISHARERRAVGYAIWVDVA